MNEKDIIEYIQAQAQKVGAEQGFFHVRMRVSCEDVIDFFMLRFDRSDGSNFFELDCSRDLELLISKFFLANPHLKALRGPFGPGIEQLERLDGQTVLWQIEDEEDDLKLAALRRRNKVMYTGRYGEEDYNPDSKIPVVSDAELQAFESEVVAKRKAREKNKI